MDISCDGQRAAQQCPMNGSPSPVLLRGHRNPTAAHRQNARCIHSTLLCCSSDNGKGSPAQNAKWGLIFCMGCWGWGLLLVLLKKKEKNELKISLHRMAKEKREQPPAWGRQRKMVAGSHVGQREPAGTGESAGVLRLLTDTEAGHQLGSLVRHRAAGEDGLQQVGGENQSDDVLRGGSDDEQLYPELEEGGQGAVHLQHVGIVPAGLGDGGAQLGVAQSAHDGEGPADGPHHQRQPRRAGLPQHPGGGDEDAGADDGPHDDGHAVDQRDGALQGHPLAFSGGGGGRRRAGAAVLLRPSSRLQHLLHRLLLLLLRHGGGRARRAPLLHRAAAAAAARHCGGERSGARSGAGRAQPGARLPPCSRPFCSVGGGRRAGSASR